MRRVLGTPLFVGACLLLSAALASAQIGPQLGSVDWVKMVGSGGTQVVRFHLHWTNPNPAGTSVPVNGTMKSQEFGVFLPDFGPIGDFHVPPLVPNSFFDLFFDVPLSQLPPEPEKRLPGQPAAGAPTLGGPRVPGLLNAEGVPCSPDTIWDGNVDIIWAGGGVSGQVLRHFGDLIVCPGGGPSYIHVRSTDCAIAAPWSLSGMCPGFTATLVNEDLTPAPNPIPSGWTGFIAVTANAAVPSGTVCCFQFHFSCDAIPAVLELCATACDCGAPGPTLGQVDWHNVGTAVRFHLRWNNQNPTAPSLPVSGMVSSQEFGVFMPDFGPIGQFNVPPMQPNSFFDVFFEVPLAELPPEPEKRLPGGNLPPLIRTAARGARPQAGPLSVTSIPCPPDTIWDGNLDIVWSGAGVGGQVQRHFGDLIVCPGGAPSFIHVKSTTCAVGAPWSVVGLCTGFSATLVNEDLTPAPNPIPPGWTGFVSVSANATVPAGTVCCFSFQFDCAGSPAVLELCATACECGSQGPTLSQVDWHHVGTLERFHLRFENPSPNAPTVPVSGSIASQAFGVFMPDFGPIGQFNLPPIAPNSFFDVFIDVPLSQLPPEPNKVVPGSPQPGGIPCPPDTIWDGNVDIIWSGAGANGQVERHYGDLITCPGGGPSFIHFHSTNCAVGAPWSVAGLCPGFNATLVNEDFSPAPNPIPSGWTGYLKVTASAAVPVGTICCFTVDFDCAGAPAALELCATACDCGQAATVPAPTQDVGFGIRATIPSPTAGPLTIQFAIPRDAPTTLQVYDVGGKLVRVLLDGPLAAGPHTSAWDGRGPGGRPLPAGAYFLRLTSGERSTSRKVMIVP